MYGWSSILASEPPTILPSISGGLWGAPDGENIEVEACEGGNDKYLEQLVY